jgi:hypothetical protein
MAPEAEHAANAAPEPKQAASDAKRIKKIKKRDEVIGVFLIMLPILAPIFFEGNRSTDRVSRA